MSNDVQVDPTPFASMARSEATLVQLNHLLKAIILHSFNQERQRGTMTISSDIEVKRRAKICLDWYRIMRADLGYTIDKIIDFLPQALRCELDGARWEPPANVRAWAPEVLARG